MSKKWMIYGATGYSGRLIAEEAVKRDLTPIVAGRSLERVRDLSQRLGLEGRAFELEDGNLIDDNLQDVEAVLHCAGPFSRTAKPMLDACIRKKTHYLDITGEIDVFEQIFARQSELREAGIVAIPGVGFDVVPSDCLAKKLQESLTGATKLTLAIKTSGMQLSPGTSKTILENANRGGRIRREGQLKSVPSTYGTRQVPFTSGDRLCVSIPWGDVSTAYHSTQIPNIEVLMNIHPRSLRRMKLGKWMTPLLAIPPIRMAASAAIGRFVKGPSQAHRQTSAVRIWGQVEDKAGNRKTAEIQTPDGYSFTADAAVSCVERLWQGSLQAGAYTPSSAFGSSLATELADVRFQFVGN